MTEVTVDKDKVVAELLAHIERLALEVALWKSVASQMSDKCKELQKETK